MRATILRRLKALEDKERSSRRKECHLRSEALLVIWRYVLAYYVGLLEPDENVHDAEERALGPKSPTKETDELGVADLVERHQNAYRRLFAACNLDIDQATRRELFDEFVGLVDRLPDRWLSKMKTELQGPYCYDGKMPEGGNVPPDVTCDNFLLFA